MKITLQTPLAREIASGARIEWAEINDSWFSAIGSTPDLTLELLIEINCCQ
jgi:hypothetical protein